MSPRGYVPSRIDRSGPVRISTGRDAQQLAVGPLPGAPLSEPHERAPHILVLDGEQRAALAVVRSLRRAGFRVTVTARGKWSLAGASRGVESHRLHRDAMEEPAAYATEVAAAARVLGVAAVMPVTDASTEAVLEHRDLLPDRCVLPCPSHEAFRAASDKVRVHELAVRLGIGVEATMVIRNPRDDIPDDPRLFPGVIRPHRSVIGDATRTRTGVAYARHAIEARRLIASMSATAFPLLLQGRIHGPGEGIFIARWGGRTIARFAHRRLREKPPVGGVSVYSKSIRLDADIEAACESLLDQLGWTGVAMIEGKRDSQSGRWQVVEVNGRFWGSLQLAIDSGVDFPSILLRAALGSSHSEPPAWQLGRKLRWEWGDTDQLFTRMLRSREFLSLPADSPGRVRSMLSYLAIDLFRERFEILRMRDPLPFLNETLRRVRVID